MCSSDAAGAFVGPAGTALALRKTKFGQSEAGKAVGRSFQINDPAGAIFTTARDKREREKFTGKAKELASGKNPEPTKLPDKPQPQGLSEGERQRNLQNVLAVRRLGIQRTQRTGSKFGTLGNRAKVGTKQTFGG